MAENNKPETRQRRKRILQQGSDPDTISDHPNNTFATVLPPQVEAVEEEADSTLLNHDPVVTDSNPTDASRSKALTQCRHENEGGSESLNIGTSEVGYVQSQAQITALLEGVLNCLNALHQRMQQNQNTDGRGLRGLDVFCRMNPKEFSGGFAPDEALAWIANLEKIFNVMVWCTDEQKVAYAVYMMVGEAADWWHIVQQGLVAGGEVVTWNQFKERVLEKYFPEDLKTAKEIEFLELEQGSMSVWEYAAKFQELAKFMPYYNEPRNERSRCAKFVNGLKAEVRQVLAPMEITVFDTLVNKGQIVEDGLKAKCSAGKTTVTVASGGPMRHFSSNRNFNQGFRTHGPATGGEVVAWNQFKERVLDQYSLEDLKTAKEIEFLKLKQGSMSVGEYAAKFEELVKFMPYHNEARNEKRKCAKFLNGLKAEIRLVLAPMEITVFYTLVNKGRIVEDGLKRKGSAGKTTVTAASGGPLRLFSRNRNFNHGFRTRGPYGLSGGRRDGRFGGVKPQGGFQGNNRNRFHNNNNNHHNQNRYN